ncbi:IMP cyclohydrolase [Halococcus saccharolyticus]|uniref:IMP cyclohydrolase n=1 Tax=Halococcus saccharolyticus DSM 5350 TaxID=1227455 RepID=M0MBF6_9EURY|nr:IMP cyclohydrolase [Halococcus saccharolyticus]EMA42683.1 IMP cyclohydrolase [Halococcus saccharolyticus DSM 5350]
MYVGRFIVVGHDIGAYRVSSRSFPDRKIVDRDGRLTVVPTAAADETDNPYVSYNCVRSTDRGAVLGNGSHVDPIAEKLARGYPPRDALCLALLALDFEKDDYDTPRIAGIVGGPADEASYIGIVRRDGITVEEVTEPTLVATYEKDRPEAVAFDAADGDGSEGAAAAATAVYDFEFEHRVCAAGVVRTEDGFETAIENGD